VLIATARIEDEEMQARVARHRDERGAVWQTIEEAMQLAEVLRHEADQARILLVDCLTLWLSTSCSPGRMWPFDGGAGQYCSESAWTGDLRDQRGRQRHRARQCAGTSVPRRPGPIEPGDGGGVRHGRAGNGGLPLQMKPAASPNLRF